MRVVNIGAGAAVITDEEEDEDLASSRVIFARGGILRESFNLLGELVGI